MLLYPTVIESIDEVVTIQGHQIRIASINRDQPWQSIATDLLALLTKPPIQPKVHSPLAKGTL